MQHPFIMGAAALLMTSALCAPCAAQITLKPSAAAKEQLQRSAAAPALKQIDLRAINASLPQATLEYYFYGDAAPITHMKYVDPAAADRKVEFRTNIFAKSNVHAVRWQVTRAPFAGPLESPAALVESGNATNSVFAIDFGDIARKTGLVVEASTARQSLKPTVNTKRLRALLPGVAKPQSAQPETSAPQIDPSVAAVTKGIIAVRPAPRFYVRVIPVDPAKPERIIGKPSEALPVIWGVKPNRQLAPTGFDVASEESFDLSFAGFVYHPSVTIENWPKGCEPIPRDDGKNAGEVAEDLGEYAIDLVNWASVAYADLKNIVISIAAELLPFVPEEVLSIALDVAMASAGLPPSLPNVDQLMEGGADYLAVQMAAQIPTPASGVLAEMAADEARAEIQRRTKEAILKSAHDIAKKKKDDTKWCRRYVSDPYFDVTIRNKGKQAANNVGLRMSANSDLLESVYLPVERLEPGQSLTLPIAYREAKNVPWAWVSQIPSEDKRAAEIQWWTDYGAAQFSFAFYLPHARRCFGDGRCEEDNDMVYKTTTQRWD